MIQPKSMFKADSDTPMHRGLSPVKETKPAAKCPTFATKRDSKPSGLRDRAMQLVQSFGGQCLSMNKLSIVKGADAFKFKCANGHIFYKFVTELQEMRPLTSRKLSKATVASSASSNSSSDEEMLTSLQRS